MPTAKKATIFPAKKARKPTATLIQTRRKTLRKTSNAWAATSTTSRPKPPPSACFTYRAEKWPILLWKQNHGWANSPTACRRGRQSLKFGIRLTNTRFGEVMPSRILSGSGFQGDNYAIMCKIAEWPQAWVKQHAYNIDYTWKPQNSRWLDLQASLWATRTKSKTNSAGGVPGDVAWFDNNWDGDCIGWLYGGTGTRPRAQDGLPNTNGRFNTRQGQALYAANNRNGLTVSNKMKLNDKLQLTLSGDYQTEKLRSRNEFADFFFGYDTNNPENIQPNLFLDQIAYPRNGRRREFNLAFNFRFEPRPWLTLTAGASIFGTTTSENSSTTAASCKPTVALPIQTSNKWPRKKTTDAIWKPKNG
jgi:putative receptor protein